MSDQQLTDQDGKEVTETGRWLAIGLAIGAGLGVAMGVALGNMAFMAIGVGAGISIGLAIGASKDRAKRKEGGGEETG
jgi:hypothetical protein